MKQGPLILLTNDDGIDAPGLAVLRDAVAAIGEVLVVAPAQQCSATSHAVSVLKDMSYRQEMRDGAVWGHALAGMPADCVKLGVLHLAPRKPDLVIAGINPGANIGNNILYSGTVAAAREGSMLGVASMAVSLDHGKSDAACHFGTAAEWAVRLIPLILERGLPLGAILNVNVPNLAADCVRGAVISRQGRSMFIDELEPSRRSGGIFAFQNKGKTIVLEGLDGEDVDDVVLREGKVSITPLHYDMTHHSFREELRQWLGGG